jgi:inosine/xanthosine triphosphate pyrophosphatase family protein
MILVLATANVGKLVELRTLLRPFAFELRTAHEFGVAMPTRQHDEAGDEARACSLLERARRRSLVQNGLPGPAALHACHRQ